MPRTGRLPARLPDLIQPFARVVERYCTRLHVVYVVVFIRPQFCPEGQAG